jgi:RHS repeat-associated protein
VGGNWLPNGVQTPQALNDYIDNTGTSPAPNTNRWKAWTPTFTNGNVYDVAGNLQKVTNGLTCNPAPCPQYGYDAENRMVSATSLLNTPDTTYIYDGVGRRVQKVQSGATTTYVYDATGNLAAEYGPPTDHGTKFLLMDHLRSTRVLVASDGTSPKRYDYLPFGEEIPQGTDGRGSEYSSGMYPSPVGLQTLEFTGKERDAETGLDYFGARYFSAAQARFTSPDWSEKPVPAPYADLRDPQTLSRYTYVRNNPLLLTDPDGHGVWSFLSKLGNAFGEAGCWCEGQEAADARARNRAENERLRRQVLSTPRGRAYVSSLIFYSIAMTGGAVAELAAVASGAEAAAGAASGELISATVAESAPGWERVGRWMSSEELGKMEVTGVAQESTELGGSRVALPANPEAFRDAAPGSRYVEYDIPAGITKPLGSGWAKIPGPNSIEGRLATAKGEQPPQMPPVRNIEVKGQK